MAAKDKILELLGLGIPAETVSAAVGCEPSYISQLIADQDFYAQVTELRMKHLSAHTQRDLTIDGLEDTLIGKMSDAIEMTYKPMELARLFQVINGAKRRGVGAVSAPMAVNKIVPLRIPEAARAKKTITISPQGEVLSVNGQTLVTMGSAQLVRQIAGAKGEDGEGTLRKLEENIYSQKGFGKSHSRPGEAEHLKKLAANGSNRK